MSKIAKQLAARLFLSLWQVTGYRVKKIDRFSEQDDLKNIAIISNTALGDFLFNTPAIGAIKKRWPDARIILVIQPRNHALVAESEMIDKVLYWDGKFPGMLSLARALRKDQVDATFILHSRTPYDIVTASLARSKYIFKDVYYADYQGKENFILAGCLSAFYDNRKNGNIHLIRQKKTCSPRSVLMCHRTPCLFLRPSNVNRIPSRLLAFMLARPVPNGAGQKPSIRSLLRN